MRLTDAIKIFGSANTSPSSANVPGNVRKEPMLMMTMVSVVRYAGGYRVYGRGSHAVVTLANDGSIIGVVRRWRVATDSESIKPSITPEQVREDILRQLQPMTKSKGTHAIVDEVEIAYYDNNKAFLQPVYHFEATILPPNERISPIRVAGFIPIAEAKEPIPDLTKKTEGAEPGKATAPDPKQKHNGIGSDPTPKDITLGEYANRDWRNDNGYISMLYSFLNGLTFLNSLIPGLTPPTTRTQWYEAWPWKWWGLPPRLT